MKTPLMKAYADAKKTHRKVQRQLKTVPTIAALSMPDGPALPKRFTLRDVHSSPRALAEFMGWEWKEETKRVRGWGGFWENKKYTAEESVRRKWDAIRTDLCACWANSPHNNHKGFRTTAELVNWCLKSMGFRKGDVYERVEAVVAKGELKHAFTFTEPWEIRAEYFPPEKKGA